MSFPPGRSQPGMNQPGNALQSQPDLRHPASNPSGLIPGMPQVPRAVEAWGDIQYNQFRIDATGANQVWRYQTPVFDLRPGLSTSYGIIPDAVPINHEGAYGMSVYLVLVVGEDTGTRPPAATTFEALYWEYGNPLQARNGRLVTLTQQQDVTEQLLGGGISLVAPFGASAFSFTSCTPGLRFWQLNFQLTSFGPAPVTLPYYVQACLH